MEASDLNLAAFEDLKGKEVLLRAWGLYTKVGTITAVTPDYVELRYSAYDLFKGRQYRRFRISPDNIRYIKVKE